MFCLKRSDRHSPDIFRKVYRIRKKQTDNIVKRKWKKDDEKMLRKTLKQTSKKCSKIELITGCVEISDKIKDTMSTRWVHSEKKKTKNDRIKVRLVAKDFLFPKVVFFFRTDSTTLTKAELRSTTSLVILCLLVQSFASNHGCVLPHKNCGFIFNATPSSDFSSSSLKYVHSTQQPYSCTSEGSCY